MGTKTFQLYLSFCIGVLLAAILFAYVLVSHFTSNSYIKLGRVYSNGKMLNVCERSCK